MKIIRARFKKEIVAEIGVPNERQQKTGKVMILCSGMPSTPSKKERIEFWTRRGYWTILFRYRGTWESGGGFLKQSPHLDVRDILDALVPQKITPSQTRVCEGVVRSIGDGKKYRIPVKKIVILGSSFGGSAAILNSKDPRVYRVVACSPVIDWREPSKEEPMRWFGKFVKDAYGEAFRFDIKDWRRLEQGIFYNPMTEMENVDGKKILIIHAKDDGVVPYRPSVRFAKKTGSKMILLARGRHRINIFRLALYKRIARFLAL